MTLKEQYPEIYKLRDVLDEHDIEYDFFAHRDFVAGARFDTCTIAIGHYQFPYLKQQLTVMQGTTSLGGDKNLLQLTINPYCPESRIITGYLTAEQVFDILQTLELSDIADRLPKIVIPEVNFEG